MRFLGMDFGERRIGLALSDPGGEFAFPLTTVQRKSDGAALRCIEEIVKRQEVAALVVGEPLNLDGSRGHAARRARRFGERLAQATGLPITFVNEALTTVEAHNRLRESGVDVRKHRGRIDAVAAQILLQEALDERRRIEG